jgi:hypothetical protein
VPFTCVPRRGYFAEVGKRRPSSRFEHSVGGKNDLPGAFCAPCKRPLLLMKSIDVRDSRLGLRLPQGRHERVIRRPGKHLERDLFDIPLLYCWSCGSLLYYRLNPEGGVDVLNHSKEQMDVLMDACLPYFPYPTSFPKKHLRLVPISTKAQRTIHEDNAGVLEDDGSASSVQLRPYLRPRHQVGGEPHFEQKSCLKGGRKCVLCRKDAPLLASVADETGSKLTFHGGSYVQVIYHYCPHCQVVSGYHECD